MSAHAIRLVTYNVRYFGHGTRGIASTKRAMDRIAHAVATLDPLPDVVCLQEVETQSIRSNTLHPAKNGETQLDRLMTALHAALAAARSRATYDAHYFPAHVYSVGKGARLYTTGLAILARHEFSVDHHNATGPHDITHRSSRSSALRGLKQTRICAHVRVRRKAQGSPAIDVFNTHLSLPASLAREFWTSSVRMGFGKNQLEEAKKLARFVEKERGSDRFVVVGDLNALPGSPVYQHLVSELGWGDPFAHMHGLTESEMRNWPTAGFMRLRMHIDHVLTGPGLEWVDFEDSHPFGDKTSPFHGLSDHVPIVGRFRAR